MVVHKPRNVSCPVCGVQRFRSPVDAVAHVESGYCDGCRGADNAARQIYEVCRNTLEKKRDLKMTNNLMFTIVCSATSPRPGRPPIDANKRV